MTWAATESANSKRPVRRRPGDQYPSLIMTFLSRSTLRRWLRRRRGRRGYAFALLRRRFALNVVAYRRQRGWTQRALANACGWAPSDISRIERGRVNPTRRKLRTLCFIFNCQESALLCKPPDQLQWIEVAPVPVRSHLIPETLPPVAPNAWRRRRCQPRWDGPYVPRLPTTQEIVAWVHDDLDDRISEEWDRDFDYDDILAECEHYRRRLDESDLL